MKRIFILITIFWLSIGFTHAAGEENKEDKPPKNMYFTEKPGPVPEKMKTGFDSISAANAENYLKFLASDLLEGRDTGTNMYDIAAQFAAVLFRMWEIKPAGDFPLRKHRRFFEIQKKQDKKKKRERTYFQEVVMKEFLDIERSMILEHGQGASRKTRTLYPNMDYINTDRRPGGFEEISAPVVFVGYGVSEKSLKFDEYKGLDVKGKIVLMFRGLPRKSKGESPFNKGKLKEKYYPTVQQMSQQEYTDPKIKLAEEKGAIAVLQVTPSAKGSGIIALSRRYKQVNDEEPIVPGKRRILSLNNSTPYWSWNRMPELYISREMAELILGLPPQGKAGGQLEKLAKKIGENFKPQSRELPRVLITIKNTFNTKIVTGSNVLGFIEGSDADLKDEAVIIGAHLDHLGKRGDYIYNGAADNASGSAAVLELARAFALNPVKPKRTILFALWTGEEHGMLGSRFYTDHPYFPLKKTVAYLNMDMIGWEWENKDLLVGILERRGYDIPEKILEEIDLSKFLMPTLAKESEEMYETIKTCRHYVGFTLCLRKSGGKIGGSDYVPFARNNIAWTHFSTGLKKYYHHPGDSIDKINFDMVRDVARFIYTIAFSFADR